MTDSLLNAISDRLAHVDGLYNRLVLLVWPSHELWPRLQPLADALGYPLVNVSLALSGRLLDVRPPPRAALASDRLDDVVEAVPGDVLLLGALELLFEPGLRLSPLPALQRLARRRPIVAAWSGEARDGYLFYAQPDHPEYRRYPLDDLVFIEPDKLH